MRISWKDIGKRGSGNKVFVMTINNLLHSYNLTNNPLSFPRHRQALDEYQALIRTARKHRIAIISYSKSRRVLKTKELDLILISREYYNSLWKSVPNKAQPKTIDTLLIELHETGFMYKTRVRVEEDGEGNVVKR